MSTPADLIARHSVARSARRLFRLLACLVVVSAGVLAVGARVAHAGSWTLVSCTQPDGQPALTEGWTTSALGIVGIDSGDTNSCEQGGSLIATTSSEAVQVPYQGPLWVFSAPADSTITGGELTATLTSPHGQAWIGTPAATYDSANVLVNCQYNEPCGTAGTYTGTFAISHPGGTSLYATAVCVAAIEGGQTCPASGGVDAQVAIHAADIQLSNDATPTASTISGTLLTPRASGNQELTFTASDTGGPGVYSVEVEIDGQSVYDATPDSNGASCEAIGESAGVLMFDHAQPCKQQESVDLPVQTAALSDGTHTLKVTVTDAAGNSSVVYDGQISTSNAPVDTAAPVIIAAGDLLAGTGVLSAQPGAWSAPAGAGTITYAYQWQDCNSEGAACQSIAGAQSSSYTPAPSDVGHTLRVLVTGADDDGYAQAASATTSVIAAAQGTLGAPNGPGGTPAATTTPGSTGVTTPVLSTGASAPASSSSAAWNGGGASEHAILRLGVRRDIARSFARRAFTLRGRLVSSAGEPISGARLQLLAQTIGSSSPHVIATATTRSNGTFAARVPAGPSRLLEVTYRALSSDQHYAAEKTITESVKAGVKLQIDPRRTESTGTITLSGQVLGPIPAKGVLVELLVRYLGHWEPFRAPRTDSAGRFSVAYQFQGATGRFPFEAKVVSGQEGFPFAQGYSAKVDVNSG